MTIEDLFNARMIHMLKMIHGGHGHEYGQIKDFCICGVKYKRFMMSENEALRIYIDKVEYVSTINKDIVSMECQHEPLFLKVASLINTLNHRR